MRCRPILLAGVWLCCWPLAAQEKPDKYPRVIHKQEAEYTSEARQAQVQGTLVLGLIVDEQGKPQDIRVLNPLGFGLDEQAMATVEKKWIFQPAIKDGKPIPFRAMVEVNYRLMDHWFDEGNERRRVQFNLAIDVINDALTGTGTKREKAVQTLLDLARQKYPAAMRVVGQMLGEGKLLPKDDEQSAALIKKASEKRYGPAMYDLGRMYLDGKQVPREPERGMKLISDSATLGSAQAQFFLGVQFEAGTTVPQDPERARRYFRLCAAAAEAVCQLRLATSMLDNPEKRDWEKVQAVAWLELAADKGLSGARERVERERADLSTNELSQVSTLKRQFTRKQ